MSNRYARIGALLRPRARFLLKLENIPYEEVRSLLSSAFIFCEEDVPRAGMALYALNPKMKY